MENFVFHNPTKIIFGKNSENQVGVETKKYSNKILMHYGTGSIKRYGVYARVVKPLKEAGVEIVELPGVLPNPRLSLVREGIDLCRKEGINFILAIGGGSAIDSAKTIAIGVPYEGDVWDLCIGKDEVKEVLPIGLVLTIASAGSEAGNGLVITKEEGWYKQVYNDERIRPRFAILNPEFTFTVPAYQTVCGAVDIMTHVMERYFTQIPHVDFTDRLCEATLKTIIENVPVVLKEPDNYDARAEIMWASTIANNDLLSSGRIPDWSSHKIEHEISAIYDIAHGAGLAIVFPAWMRYVYKRNPDKFAQFATRVWDVEADSGSPETIALEGIKRLQNFFEEIGMPVTLKEVDIPDDRFEEMASKCLRGGQVGNLMTLGKDDIVNIYKLAQ